MHNSPQSPGRSSLRVSTVPGAFLNSHLVCLGSAGIVYRRACYLVHWLPVLSLRRIQSDPNAVDISAPVDQRVSKCAVFLRLLRAVESMTRLQQFYHANFDPYIVVPTNVWYPMWMQPVRVLSKLTLWSCSGTPTGSDYNDWTFHAALFQIRGTI